MVLYDGSSSTSAMLGNYCGDSIPLPSHVSSSNEVLVHFDSYFQSHGSVTRFKMEYNPIGKGPFKYYVIMFLTFLGPPTHLFDDVILEWSLTYQFKTTLNIMGSILKNCGSTLYFLMFFLSF